MNNANQRLKLQEALYLNIITVQQFYIEVQKLKNLEP
jgi:hypothetical protein